MGLLQIRHVSMKNAMFHPAYTLLCSIPGHTWPLVFLDTRLLTKTGVVCAVPRPVSLPFTVGNHRVRRNRTPGMFQFRVT